MNTIPSSAPHLEDRQSTSSVVTPLADSDRNRNVRKEEKHAEVEVGIDEMIAGHPKRAMVEVEMRSRLEAVRSEVDVVLKMHGSMAKGERKSWLKQIERQNEENSYQVSALLL